jgi:pyruvate dehydrogenase E1 component alpha subunit
VMTTTTSQVSQPGPPVTPPDGAGIHMLREMLRIRRFEEKCAELYSAAVIRGFVHLYIGQEAIAVGVMQSLGPDDSIVSTYREHGHALARGVSTNACMAEMFGKATGCSGGRGGSMHLFDAGTRFYGGNAIVGGGLPLAVGLALADKLRDRSTVAACFFGDGAVAEGEFHEAINLASLWKLPVLFACENNLYAMGTRIAHSHAQTDLYKRAASYRVPSEAVDGMDLIAVTEAARRATGHIRAGNGPYFLEFKTYRFRAHSMYDPELYRQKTEVDEWKQRDPIPSYSALLRRDGLMSDADFERIDAEVLAEIEAAVAFAESSPWEPIEHLTRHVYSEGVLA